MKLPSLQEWIIAHFRKRILTVFFLAFAFFFLIATYFGLLDRVQAVLDGNRAFASTQILNLQVYDYTRVNFDLETFAKRKPFEFVRVLDASGITIGKWSKSSKNWDFESPLQPIKWSFGKDLVSLEFSNKPGYVVSRTEILDSRGNLIGVLEVVFTLVELLKYCLFLDGVFVLISIAVYYVLQKFLIQVAQIASSPIAEIAGTLDRTGSAQELEKVSVKSGIFEVNFLIERFQDLSKRLSEKEAAQIKTERLAAVGSLSAQVAHDIRSPLAALETMISDFSYLPEGKRLMIRSAIGRIRDISNQLLQKRGDSEDPKKEVNYSDKFEPTPQLLSDLVDQLVSEKRMQFRSNLGTVIEHHLGISSYGLFSIVQPIEFKRVLSNLINNAVEALVCGGWVRISLQRRKDQIEVRVQDNGKGIDCELLPKLAHFGMTYQKEGGSGLGLYHARISAESWNGRLDISSELGRGTIVILTLPKSEPPKWFLKYLDIIENSEVIVLDDDESVHQIWKSRFEKMELKKNGIQLRHFSTPASIEEWYKKQDLTKARSRVYLVDYELLNHQSREKNPSGLEVIEALQIQRESILVSSHCDEKSIKDKCDQLGVKLLPKGMAGFVPIRVKKKSIRYDVVLVDDDELIRSVWASSALAKGISLKTFSQADEFFDFAGLLDPSTQIYVDADLGNGVKGEAISEEISKMGFTQVFLATGYRADSFPPMPWLAGIQGKTPPWKLNSVNVH